MIIPSKNISTENKAKREYVRGDGIVIIRTCICVKYTTLPVLLKFNSCKKRATSKHIHGGIEGKKTGVEEEEEEEEKKLR